MKTNSKIVCVTGASGLIGKRLVTGLIGMGVHVRVLCHSKPNRTEGVECFNGSLEKKDVLREFLKDASYLFHCAAELHDESKMQNVNVEGTANLLEAVSYCSSLQYYCHMSSAGVVGESDVKSIAEDAPCFPQNEYERTKYEAEKLVRNTVLDCSTVILRPVNVMDEDRPDVVGLPLRNSLKDRLFVFVKGNECAHQVHAQHVANTALFFMQKKFKNPEVFFVGNDEDPENTYKGIWNLFSRLDPNGEVKPIKYSLPAWFPFLVRRMKGVRANIGDVKYSSSKLSQQGVMNAWGLTETLEAIIKKYGK